MKPIKSIDSYVRSELLDIISKTKAFVSIGDTESLNLLYYNLSLKTEIINEQVVSNSIEYNPKVEVIAKELQELKKKLSYAVCFYDPKGNSCNEVKSSKSVVEDAIFDIIMEKPHVSVFNAYIPVIPKAKRPDGT